MKGLILCAGKATSIEPFSLFTPKALLPVANLDDFGPLHLQIDRGRDQ
jgi:dTDP-glucose pyrophosphorylase